MFPYLKPPLETLNLVPRVPGNEVEIPCDVHTKKILLIGLALKIFYIAFEFPILNS